MKNYCFYTTHFGELEGIISNAIGAIDDKKNSWQDTYDERSGNEPQYDSQIDRWQEALDRLEEKIDAATELQDRLEEWLESLYQGDEQLDSRYKTISLDDEEWNSIIEDLTEFNYEYRGLTPVLKDLKKAETIFYISEVRKRD